MARQSQKKSRLVRPIKTKRDAAAVTAVVEQLAEKSGEDEAAELRLQLLLKELDRAEEPEDDSDADLSSDNDYPRPGRRWSDETSDRE